MKITAPAVANTTIKRFAYYHRLMDKSKLVHNTVGQWYNVGLTVDEYNLLPGFIKERFSYQAKLDEAQWKTFTNLYMEFIHLVSKKINAELEDIYLDDTIAVNIDSEVTSQ